VFYNFCQFSNQDLHIKNQDIYKIFTADSQIKFDSLLFKVVSWFLKRAVNITLFSNVEKVIIFT